MLTPLAHFSDLVDQFPRTGRAGVALALGKSDQVFAKELSPANQRQHKLGLQDVTTVLRMLQQYDGIDVEPFLDAFVSQFGYRLAGRVEGCAEQDLGVLSADAARKAGEASFVVVVADSDGHICDNERKETKRHVRKAKDALRTLDRAIDARYAKGRRGD